jgi:hypothetical protein
MLAILSACSTNIPSKVEASPTPLIRSQPRFQVFIINHLSTCLVGNEFASGNVCAGTECGDCSCSWEQHDPPAPQVGIPPGTINEPQYDAYPHKICLDISLTNEEINDIITDMRTTRDLVYEWSAGALDLQMEYIILPHVFTGFTAPDFVIGPFEIDDDLLNDYVDTSTDFVYVVSGVYDRAQELQLAYWCGSSYGELSIHGASYSYIQYNHEACNSVTISGELIYEPLIHEWMHNLDWALFNINQVSDLYQDASPDWSTWQPASWPACSQGSVNLLDWFPSVDLCEWDPDWVDCNNTASAGTCFHAGEDHGGISWYEHVISSHYPRDIQFIGNYCRDGRQDFSETGVDSGWPCP